MASAGEVIGQEPDLDDVKDPKKRRFFNMKNLRQLFTRKKRTKSKDDELKTKSMANVSESMEREDTTDDDGDGGCISGSLSMSHDSVFSSDKVRDTSVGELTKSMEALHGTGFKNELASKLGLRPPTFAGGAGSSGTRQRNTIAADVLMESDLRARSDKSYESDHSLMSMEGSENEIEEDFFRDKWASNSSLPKRTTSPDPGFGSAELDLNVISSTSGLNIAAAKHKIAIKPKGKRASAHVLGRRHRTTSPKPLGMQTLPEESAPCPSTKQDVLSEDEGLHSTASLESLGGSSGKNSPLPLIEPIVDYDDEPAPKPKASPRVAKKPTITAPKPSLTKPSGQSERKASPKEVPDEKITEFSKVVLKKTNSSEDKRIDSPEKTVKNNEMRVVRNESNREKVKKNENNDVILKMECKNKEVDLKKESETKNDQQTMNKSVVSQVIMRQKSTSGGDSSKRQTIAVLSPSEDKESSAALEAKRVSKRSSWIEQTTQDKEDEHRYRNDQPTPPKNEFAQMFNKFQRRASQKKDDGPEGKPTAAADVVLKAGGSSPSVEKSGTDSPSPSLTVQTGATTSSSPQPVPSPKSGLPSLSPVAVSSSSTSSVLSRSPTAGNTGNSSSISPGHHSGSPASTGLASPTSGDSKSKNVFVVSKSSSHSVTPTSPGLTSPTSASSGDSKSKNMFVVGKSSSHSVTPTSPGLASPTTLDGKPKNSFVVGKSSSSVQQPSQESKSKTVVIEKPKTQNSVTSPEKKTVELFPKKVTIEENSKTSVSSVTEKVTVANAESKPKSVVITKVGSASLSNDKTEQKTENDENAQPKSDDKPSTATVTFRRPSPMQKDRVRSQTLPEQPVLTQKVANQNTTGSSSEKGSTRSPTASPQRSKSMKPMSTTTSSGEDSQAPVADGRPSWVAMAKRKTVGWNVETKEEEEKAEEKVEKKVEQNETPTVQSENSSKKSIKDLMSKFQ